MNYGNRRIPNNLSNKFPILESGTHPDNKRPNRKPNGKGKTLKVIVKTLKP